MSKIKMPDPIYMIRRKGMDDFVTRPTEVFAELEALPKMFETKIAWDADQAEAYAQARVLESRPTYFGDGYQAGWNSALEQAMKVIESISVPAGNSAAGELAFLWTMDNMREARDAIRALKGEQS